MQGGGNYWDAITYLKQVQELNPNLHYRVKYDLNNRPEAICWMLPEMHQDLLRYGDILFLDAQKRDMNKPGWPYIGPVVKDNENKIRVVTECICISESMEMYQWIIEAMKDMELIYSRNNIRFIYAISW